MRFFHEVAPHPGMSVLEAPQVATSEERVEISLLPAHEEPNHKVRLELEYDDFIQTET